MSLTETSPNRRLAKRRLVRTIAIVLGVGLWMAVLGLVGFISSRPNPVIGDTAQQLLFTYVLLLPAIGWLGSRLARRHSDEPIQIHQVGPSRRRLLTDGAFLLGGSLGGTVITRAALFAAADPTTPTPRISTTHGRPDGERVLVAYEGQYGSTAEIANEIGFAGTLTDTQTTLADFAQR